MTTENSILGSIRSYFSNDSPSKDHRPIVDLESDSHTFEKTFEYDIERTVELLHFESSTLVVEYDRPVQDDQSQLLKSVTGVEKQDTSAINVHRTAGPAFDNTVSSVNQMAINHREQLGTIDVHVERPAVIEVQYDRVTNLDELPDDVLRKSGTPRKEKVARNENDDDFTERYRYTMTNGFTAEEDGVYWDKTYSVEQFTDDATIEVSGTMADVLDEAIAGGTSNLRAASASGQVMLPDSEIGSGRDDVTQVQSLPGQ